MTPERWTRIDELFNSALERDAAGRADFLKEACAGDQTLIDEVKSLLAAHDRAESFLEGGALPGAEAALAPGRSLGRYEIVALLGAGGMGQVYRARDSRLEREVAVKVLPRTLAGDADRLRRFEQEARAAGQLNHPNLLAVHDVGMQDGLPYIVSELLDGVTLSARLDEGALPVSKAAVYAVQIAHGLAAAHARGIVHRDVKPDNVVVTRGGPVKLLDFGLARAVGSEPAAATPEQSLPGTLLGTVGYMSPEQVRGEPVDSRSDIFALGLVLFEMLAGHRAFERATVAETLTAILRDDPVQELEAQDRIPPALARIVRRCLEKQPDRRFQSAGALAAELEAFAVPAQPPVTPQGKRRRLAPLLAGVLLLAAVLGLIWRYAGRVPRPSSPAPAAPTAIAPSIAVLPLVNLSSDKEQEYFSDGLAEEILNLLAGVPGLQVAARTSAFAFKGKSEDVREIGRKLGVATVLEGSARKAGDRIRISAQLVDAASGYHLWTQTYDRRLTDIFAVQDEIARDVVAALKLKLLAPPLSQDRRTASSEAYNQYLLGKQFYHRNNVDGFRRAKQAFEKAVALDPGYAPAWAWLSMAAQWVAEDAESLSSQREGKDDALAAANKAIALAPELPEGYLARGWVRLPEQLDFAGSRADFEKALALRPDDPIILNDYSTRILKPMGRLREAIAAQRRALELDPLNARIWSGLGFSLAINGENGRAREAFERSLEISPEQSFTPYNASLTFLVEGKPAEALALSQRSTKESFRLTGAALALHDLGRADEAQEALDRLIASFGHTSAYQIAQVYAWRGDKDRAFEWLERAVDQHDSGLNNAKVHPLFVKLRGDPRHAALLKKLGLPLE